MAICIEARQAKAAMGAMPNKTDRNDARGIARIVRTGWYRAVHVKHPSCRSWRALPTARRLVLNKRRDVENGVRALLREAGLKVGTPSRKNFAARVGELVADDPVLAGLAGSDEWVSAFAGKRHEEACRRYTQINNVIFNQIDIFMLLD